MLNAETIADGAKKAISREEVFVRPLIEAAIRLIHSEADFKKLNDDEGILIVYFKNRSGYGSHIHKTFELQIGSRGKTVLNVVWDDEPDEKPLIRKFRCGDWEDAILNASPRFH